MVPDYFNPSPSDDPIANGDPHQFFFPTYDQSSVSSYSVFFPDQTEHFRFQMHQDQQPQQVGDADYQAQYTGSQGLAPEIKPSKGMKISLWKKSVENDDEQIPVKWMSSKMRMIQEMKNKCAENGNTASNSPHETDHFSSSNSSSNNTTATTTPFRVCSDCNTTKTPLWRSGPKGPKSLCNACGIRQRKARRAMAAAAAAAAAASAEAADASPQSEAKSTTTSALKIKVQSKERVKNIGVQTSNTTSFKKRCTKAICSASSAGPSSHAQQKNTVFEDFLFNLSKNLAYHRVFPQDEKEAAILLMALSSGLVHG